MKDSINITRWESSVEMQVDWTDIDLAPDQNATVRDLWLHQNIGIFHNSYSASVQGSGVVLFTVTPL